jgi:hypothetical protein
MLFSNLLLFRHFLPPIYKISVKEARWEAVCQEMCGLTLKIKGNFPRLRARPAHFVGHLPQASQDMEERLSHLMARQR